MYTPGLTDLGTYPGGTLRDWYQLNPSEPIGPFRGCFSPASDFRNDLKGRYYWLGRGGRIPDIRIVRCKMH